MRRLERIGAITLIAGTTCASGKSPSASFAEILKSYQFVADFSQKEPEREVSDEVFWRYPLPMPKIEFPMEPDLTDPAKELPATKGDGRAVDHLNRGRILFLEKKYAEAKGTWLGARARYGKDYPFHRRNDYFIGLAFLNLALEDMKARNVPFDEQVVKGVFANSATFLSWAFIVKTDHPDPLIDAVTPKGLYNLAAVYWRFNRFSGAFGAADTGLNFLRKTDRKEYRPAFHRIVAESHIKNRSYLDAIQTLDLAIRQDEDPVHAAAAFARAGDIYFDLNNYELAEDAYAHGSKIDEDLRQINPAQLVLRGESLFWLGKFDESQRVLHYALEGASYRKEVAPLPEGYAPWAALRLADGYLARAAIQRDKVKGLAGDKPCAGYERDRHQLMRALAPACRSSRDSDDEKVKEQCRAFDGDYLAKADKLEPYCGIVAQARLEYAKVSHAYRGSLAARLAKMREACLELPFYEGHNVKHARALLEEAKEGAELPGVAKELAWACQVGSYTDRERTPEMLERVKLFANGHPESRFLRSFESPVREYQAARIEDHFQKGDVYSALSFFEKTRKNLFPKVSEDLVLRLFVSYADIGKSKEASEFWEAYRKAAPDTDLKAIRQARVASDLSKSAPWTGRHKALAGQLAKRSWKLEPEGLALRHVARILGSDVGDDHLEWIAELARHWGAKSHDLVCDLEYPALSRLYDKRPARRGMAISRASELIKAELPKLFKDDESCALSLLELEAQGLRSDPKALADLYVKRADWPLVGGYLHLFWTIAEHVFDDGDKASATRMWTVIRDKGPAGAPEVQFAKARLDPTRTEFEKLWD